MAIHGIYLPEDFRDRLAEVAYQKRTSMSQLIRDGIDEFLVSPSTAKKNWSSPVVSGSARLNVDIDPEIWKKLKIAAIRNGMTLTHAFRMVVIHQVEAGESNGPARGTVDA